MAIRNPVPPTVLLLSALVSATSNAEAAGGGAIFRLSADDGSVLFTDQALDGATRVGTLATSPTDTLPAGALPADTLAGGTLPGNTPGAGSAPIAIPVSRAARGSQGGDADSAAPNLPTTIRIVEPSNDALLRDPDRIDVTVAGEGATLADSGLIVELWADGRLVDADAVGALSMPAPERGTHTLTARLVDDAGRVLLESTPSTVYVQRYIARP